MQKEAASKEKWMSPDSSALGFDSQQPAKAVVYPFQWQGDPYKIVVGEFQWCVWLGRKKAGGKI